MGVDSHTCLAIFGPCDLEMIWASLDSIFSGGKEGWVRIRGWEGEGERVRGRVRG